MKPCVSLLFLTSALLFGQKADACTNFLVGKDATTDGSTLITYAADSYALYGSLFFSPAKDHPSGSVRAVDDRDTGRPWCKIAEASHTYSVVGNMNEHQLTIGETTWEGRHELFDTTGIDYGNLMCIALERCRTAREAILCMTELVAQYGYSSEGETFSIGDPNEVWIMDMCGKGPGNTGAVWVAARVPDSCICAHANMARITTIGWPAAVPPRGEKMKGRKDVLVSPDGHWMWSRDLISFAREKGYFHGKDEDFSFQAAYCPYQPFDLAVCEPRVWSFFRRYSDAMDSYYDFATGHTLRDTDGKDAGTPMPLWLKPNRKISAQDLKECMRDQYEGTPLDITQGTAAGPWHSKLRYGSLAFTLDSTQYWYPRPIATQQTGWSFVAQMRGYADAKAGGILWFGVDDAATCVYVPLYCRITDVPECFREGNGDLYTYSPTSAWWTYNIVANWAYSKYSAMLPDIQAVQSHWENLFNSQIAFIDRAASLSRTDEEARRVLTAYSCAQAQQSTAAWRELGIYLLIKYLDGQQRKEDANGFLRNEWGVPEMPNRPAFPEPFLRQIAPETEHD